MKKIKETRESHFKKSTFIVLIILGFLLYGECKLGNFAFADETCKGRFFNPLTDICWSCFFPITMGSITVMSEGHHPDTENPSSPLCICMQGVVPRFGIAIGYWGPVALVDVTRHPYCMVGLGGLKLPTVKAVGQGSVADYSAANNHSFYYFHYIPLPLMAWFSILSDGSCRTAGRFGVGYLSELDPSWRDDTLSNILFPENGVVAAHILQAQAASRADCLAATTHLPLDQTYWSVGCQGSLYPVNGVVQAHVDSVQAATLIAERALLLLHRLGFVKDSSKENLCEEHYDFYLPKSRYRYQMTYPKVKDCYPFGHSTTQWSSNVVNPLLATEDYTYLIWKKTNCCAY